MTEATSSSSPVRAKPRAKKQPATPGRDASTEAQRIATAVLEVLGGTLSPTDAAAALSLSTSRYYALEAKALQALVHGCEPGRGAPTSQQHERTIAKLERENTRLQGEIARQQALLRALQRSIGLKQPATKRGATKAGKPAKAKRRKRKVNARALVFAERLRPAEAAPPQDSGAVTQTSSTPPAV
jgi:uncharacterized protein (DUF2267 family)